MIDDNKSDTHQFIKWVLRPQLSANPKLLYNAEWQEMIEELIGSDKLLFLDGKTKEFVIYNEDEGKEVDNIGWLSNTYSIQPTSYGLRNYTYDFETNKMAWKTNSWWDKKDDDPYHYSGLLDKPKDNSKIDLSGYSTETHYDNEGNVTHTTHTPNKHNNGARFTSYPKNTITVNDNENNMYNGKKLDWQDICYLDNEELLEVCEENPIGIAKYIQEIILGGKYDCA
jgi:hypothetical protein